MRSPRRSFALHSFAHLSLASLFLSGLSVLPGLLFLLVPTRAGAQNSYPASGDALIHGLTIGTGPATSGYANTAIGITALFSNTAGFSNSAFGNGALANNTNGYWNTASGSASLYLNTTGYGNSGFGVATLISNTTGSDNTAHGAFALGSNTSGFNNTAVGLRALNFNTTGNNNVALGFDALLSNSSGTSNVALGIFALAGNSTGSNLVAVGDSTLSRNTTGLRNTALGSKALTANTSGQDNLAAGYQCLFANTIGFMNMALGTQALYANQGGVRNIAIGALPLYTCTNCSDNIALGNFALLSNTNGGYNLSSGSYSMYYNTTGSFNCAYGLDALEYNTTGYYNTALGDYTGTTNAGNLSNTTELGYNAIATASNSVVIGNSLVTSIGGYANWTNFSDGRYKKNINENVPGLAFINKLKPVTYTLDIDGIEAKLHAGQKNPKGPDGSTSPDTRQDPIVKQARQDKAQVVYTGFVAQDVYKTSQSIGYDFSGVDKPKDDQQSFYGLRYSDFVAPLVKAVQELSATNDSLVAANAQLNARLTNIEQVLGIGKESALNGSVISLSLARLGQNIPNPFSQTTLINYYVPQGSGQAFIQITDMTGQVVRSVALSGNGNGQLTLQTGQLAAGGYTYSLFVGGQLIDTKKMLLAK